MKDNSDLKSQGEKAWNIGRTTRKTEKNNGNPKSNLRHIKKELNGAYLSE
jgi:hypothetical protein